MKSCVLFLALLLAGCDVYDYRTKPEQQVEDYSTCLSGKMKAYQTQYGEIKCQP